MGGKSGAKQPVVDYRISLHLGVCLGPVDRISEVRIGDKPVGIDTYTSNGRWHVSNMNLFGGPKKGGGIQGTIHFLFGRANQVMPEFLAAKHGRTPETMSGYRGITSIFLTSLNNGSPSALRDGGVVGFTVGSNNPIVPNIDVTVTAWAKGLGDGKHAIGPDNNPAHIIYDAMTDVVVGAGYGNDQIDLPSFLSASAVLYDEEFGLSYQWMTSTPVEQFVNEVLSTISANMTFNLATGKWELKLLRGDYEADELPIIYPGNAALNNFQRKGWGETINELIVTWVNPENEEEETVTIHDNANLAIQGATVSDSSKNYPGIRNGELAMRVGERDLRQASAPLASAEVSVNKTQWNLKTGDVVKFQWPEHGVETPIVMRVLKANYGKRDSGSITVSLLEDIFSFGVAQTSFEPGVDPNPSQPPIDPPYALITSAPYYLVAQVVGDTPARQIEYPSAYSALLANTGLKDLREIDAISLEPVPEGGSAYQEAATLTEVGRFQLIDLLAAAPSSAITRPSGAIPGLAVGAFLLIGTGATHELCRITALSSTTITVNRGVLDTVPRDWAAGTAVWVIGSDAQVIDGGERLAGDEVTYKFLPITSLGRLSESDATAHVATLVERVTNPLRPANVRINGTPFNQTASGFVGHPVTATWANRNRLTETNTVLSWTAANTLPEEGQTTELRVYNGGTLVNTITDLTGTSYELTDSDLGSPGDGDSRTIRFYAKRDDLYSYQYASVTVLFGEAPENLLLASRGFEASPWSTIGVGVVRTPGAANGPVNGTGSAVQIVAGDGADFGGVSCQTVPEEPLDPGEDFVMSVVVKNDGIDRIGVLDAFGARGMEVNLTTQAVTTLDPDLFGVAIPLPEDFGVEALGDGWFHVWGKSKNPQETPFAVGVIVLGLDGDGVKGFLIDHAQITLGTEPPGIWIPAP